MPIYLVMWRQITREFCEVYVKAPSKEAAKDIFLNSPSLEERENYEVVESELIDLEKESISIEFIDND